MKLILLASCLVLAASTACGAQHEPASLIEVSPPTPQEEIGPLTEPRHVGFGMAPEEVITAMKGKPDVVLAPDLWVYWAFRISTDPAAAKFDTLVIYFGQNRVVKYRLVERKGMLALIAGLRKQAAKPPTVAKK